MSIHYKEVYDKTEYSIEETKAMTDFLNYLSKVDFKTKSDIEIRREIYTNFAKERGFDRVNCSEELISFRRDTRKKLRYGNLVYSRAEKRIICWDLPTTTISDDTLPGQSIHVWQIDEETGKPRYTPIYNGVYVRCYYWKDKWNFATNSEENAVYMPKGYDARVGFQPEASVKADGPEGHAKKRSRRRRKNKKKAVTSPKIADVIGDVLNEFDKNYTHVISVYTPSDVVATYYGEVPAIAYLARIGKDGEITMKIPAETGEIDMDDHLCGVIDHKLRKIHFSQCYLERKSLLNNVNNPEYIVLSAILRDNIELLLGYFPFWAETANKITARFAEFLHDLQEKCRYRRPWGGPLKGFVNVIKEEYFRTGQKTTADEIKRIVMAKIPCGIVANTMGISMKID